MKVDQISLDWLQRLVTAEHRRMYLLNPDVDFDGIVTDTIQLLIETGLLDKNKILFSEEDLVNNADSQLSF